MFLLNIMIYSINSYLIALILSACVSSVVVAQESNCIEWRQVSSQRCEWLSEKSGREVFNCSSGYVGIADVDGNAVDDEFFTALDYVYCVRGCIVELFFDGIAHTSVNVGEYAEMTLPCITVNRVSVRRNEIAPVSVNGVSMCAEVDKFSNKYLGPCH